MNISVVIPNYNGEKLLDKNLPKVFEELKSYEKGKTELIVVDDKSEDKSIEILNRLSKTYENLKVFENENNSGFSSSVNKGVRASKGEIIILLNSDVYPEKGFLQPLLKNFEDKEVFAVGCLEKSLEKDKIVLRGRGLGKWEKGFLIHRKGEIDKKNTLWASGGSSAFRKTIWDELGGLNELYNPFYWEDIDLSYRALKSGYKVLFEPKSIVVHEHEKGAIKSKYSSFEVRQIAYRNQFIFVRENATDIDLKIKHILWLPYHFAKALATTDRAFFLGYFKSLVLLPKVIKSSFTYQRGFVKKDSEVIQNYSE